MRDVKDIHIILVLGIVASLLAWTAARMDAHFQAGDMLAEQSVSAPVLPAKKPAWISERHAVIALVIDDVGMDHGRSQRALKLPAAVTMAFLPYSPHIRQQAAQAKSRGHDLLVHLPMQADSATVDPGPNYLGTDLTKGEVRRRVVKNLSAFDGYIGANNHMGSKFTRDRELIEVLMDELRQRHVMFLDSKTAPDSVAETVARIYGLRSTHRDIFLDHFDHPAFVADALLQAEKIALKTGSAVVIGHPKDITLAAVEKWIPTLKDKGIKLVRLTEVTELRKQKRLAARNVR